MPREITEVNTTVGNLPVKIRVKEFPIIEDFMNDMILEGIFRRQQREDLSTTSPVGRGAKDFIIKANVVGE